MSAHMIEVSLLGIGTVLRLERDAWSMAKWLRRATKEYAPPPPPPDTLVAGANSARPAHRRSPPCSTAFLYRVRFPALAEHDERKTTLALVAVGRELVVIVIDPYVAVVNCDRGGLLAGGGCHQQVRVHHHRGG